MSDPCFQVGRTSGDHVIVSVRRRSHPSRSDYWDGNWVDAAVEVRAGRFRGEIDAFLRTDEFLRFKQSLLAVSNDLRGVARFSSMEDWLAIEAQGDGKGHFVASCVVLDEAGCGNRLEFALEFDQTEIPGIVEGLDGVLRGFPVLGDSPGTE